VENKKVEINNREYESRFDLWIPYSGNFRLEEFYSTVKKVIESYEIEFILHKETQDNWIVLRVWCNHQGDDIACSVFNDENFLKLTENAKGFSLDAESKYCTLHILSKGMYKRCPTDPFCFLHIKIKKREGVKLDSLYQEMDNLGRDEFYSKSYIEWLSGLEKSMDYSYYQQYVEKRMADPRILKMSVEYHLHG